MRNSSLATGGKNRFGVRREALPLGGPSPVLRTTKQSDVVQEVFAQKARSMTDGSKGGVALQRTVSSGGIHLNELHTEGPVGRGPLTSTAERTQ
jgi:hypothetical protein